MRVLQVSTHEESFEDLSLPIPKTRVFDALAQQQLSLIKRQHSHPNQHQHQHHQHSKASASSGGGNRADVGGQPKSRSTTPSASPRHSAANSCVNGAQCSVALAKMYINTAL